MKEKQSKLVSIALENHIFLLVLSHAYQQLQMTHFSALLLLLNLVESLGTKLAFIFKTVGRPSSPQPPCLYLNMTLH